ncbi:MAG: hypothetical protein Q7S32_04920 [bacterium]|nr:hypothetical protein [bacterium]
MLAKILEKVKEWQTELILALATIFIASLSFQAGKINTLNHLGVAQSAVLEASAPEDWSVAEATIPPTNTKSKPTTPNSPQGVNFQVVGSKNSDKYHFLWCPGAGKISEKNKITFAGEDEAKAAGYILASNCQR